MPQPFTRSSLLVAVLCLAAPTILGLAGCSRPAGGMADRMSKVRAMQRQAMMKKSGMAQYLAGVDDNSPIVFVAIVEGLTQIYTVRPDGENFRQLTREPGYKTRPVWNLAHSRIAYFRYPEDTPMGDSVSIVVMHDDGSSPKVLAQNKKIDARKIRMSWKPDGSVLYVQELDFPTILYGYTVDTGTQVETIRLPKNSFMTEIHSISPDMTYLAGAGPSQHDNIIHIGTIRRDGKKETDLMQPFHQIPYHLGTVVWAYHSQLVAFELDKIIMVMSKSFSLQFEAYPLTPQDFAGELSGPAFSPSGRQVACIMETTSEGNIGSGDQSVSSDVWLMNVNGTKQRKITHTGSCFDPHW